VLAVQPRTALRAGWLAALCVPFAAFAQTTPAAPQYRGIVTLPPGGGQAAAPPASSPAIPAAPAAAAAGTSTPAAPAQAAPQYRGIVTLPPAGGEAAAPPETSPGSPPSPPAAGWTQPPPPAPGGATANAGTPLAPAAPAGAMPEQAISGRPIIRDTATLVIDGRAILLAGINGVGGAPLNSFKDYVTENGGIVTCLPANAGPYTYTCRLPDGTDLAMTALVNGAARLGDGASAEYRAQEASARANHRGIWSISEQAGGAVPACVTNRAVR